MTVLSQQHLGAWGGPLPPVYIELGVGMGSSMAIVAEHADIEKLYGVEVNPHVAAIAAEKFENDPRIKIITGSSVDVLPTIINPQKHTLFFIDSHYEPNVPKSLDPNVGQCPLLKELEIIINMPWAKTPYIMIDDYDIFCSNRWWDTYAHPTHDRSQWPTYQQIHDLMRSLEYKYTCVPSTDGILYCW